MAMDMYVHLGGPVVNWGRIRFSSQITYLSNRDYCYVGLSKRFITLWIKLAFSWNAKAFKMFF